MPTCLKRQQCGRGAMGFQWVGRYWAGEVGKVKKEPPPGAAVPAGSEHQVGNDEAEENAGSTDASMLAGS